MAKHYSAMHAGQALEHATGALQRCALLFTLVEGQLDAGNVAEAVKLAKIGHETARSAWEVSQYDAEIASGVNHA